MANISEIPEPFVVIIVTEGARVSTDFLTAATEILTGTEQERTHGTIISRAVFTESTPATRIQIAETLVSLISAKVTETDPAERSFMSAWLSDLRNKTMSDTVTAILDEIHKMGELENLPSVYVVDKATLAGEADELSSSILKSLESEDAFTVTDEEHSALETTLSDYRYQRKRTVFEGLGFTIEA